MEYNLKMLQFYLGLYGFAALLCLLGYLYAWVDWQLSLRRQRATALPCIPPSATPTVGKTKEARHIVRFGNTTQALVSQYDLTKPEEAVQRAGRVECSTEDSKPTISMEDKNSWNKRRVERRQRYKEEKHAISKATSTSLSENLKDTDVFQTVSSPDDSNDSSRPLIPAEILAEHEMCSRRESVQVTDLDEKPHTSPLCHVERLSTE